MWQEKGFDAFLHALLSTTEVWHILPTGKSDEFGWADRGPSGVRYYVSSFGRVFWAAPRANPGLRVGLKALRREGRPRRRPHLKTNLALGREKYRTVRVHRLVLATYGDWVEQRGGSLIRHKNGDGCDNRIENLCRGTHSENLLDSYRLGERSGFDDTNLTYRVGETCLF
jgi:hypothetical protein